MSGDVRLKIVVVVALLLASAGVASAGGPADAGRKARPFRLAMEFTKDRLEVRSLGKDTWSVGTSIGGPAANGTSHTCYVGPGRVATSLQAFDALPYSFAVDFGADGIRLTSITGTNWSALEYSCGGTSPCRIVVTENGVTGDEVAGK